MASRGWVIVSSVLCMLALLYCSGDQGGKLQTGPPKDLAGEDIDRSRCDPSGKRVVKIDLNRDEEADVWNIYAKKEERGAKVDVLVCKAIDLNFDGRKDMWKYYDDRGNLMREELDLDFDGRVDMMAFRRAGKIHKQELDTNYDGRTDIWKHFEGGNLSRIDRDSNHDGKVDYWEYYEGGTLDRIGYDKDGDGRVDQWDRAPSKGTAAAAPEAAPPPPSQGEGASK